MIIKSQPRFGIVVPHELSFDAQVQFVKNVENIGNKFRIAGVYDHPQRQDPNMIYEYRSNSYQSPLARAGIIPPPFELLEIIAQKTEHMQLLTDVLVLPLYSEVEVARKAVALHVASGGRFMFGIGVGWHPGEYAEREFGEDFKISTTEDPSGIKRITVEHNYVPSFHNRGRKIEQQILRLRKIWSGEERVLSSQELTFLQDHPIKIFLAGKKEKTVRRAAEYGNGWIQGENISTKETMSLAGYLIKQLDCLQTDRSQFRIILKINLVRPLPSERSPEPEKILEQFLQFKGITDVLLSTNGGLEYPDQMEKHLGAIQRFLPYLP